MKRFLFLISAMIIYIPLMAQDIAQWRGPHRDGKYTENGLLKKWPDAGPALLWHFDELGDGHTSAAVTSNGVYTSGMKEGKGIIFALDHQGKLLWKKEYGEEWTENWNGVRSTPLVYKDKIYVLSALGKLVCLNVGNGQIVWSVDLFKDYDGRNIEWGITENLLIDGNTLFCTPGGKSANVIALDRNSGKLIWKSGGNGQKSGYCSPILIKLAKRNILVNQMEGSVQGIDAANGTFLWSHEQTNQYAVHPNNAIYSEGYLYCASGYGRGGLMLKLSDDGSKITEVWRDSKLDPRLGGFVLVNGRLYGTGDNNRKLFCIDWKTGKEVYSSPNLTPGNIIYDEGLLYIYSESGKVGLVEPKADDFNVVSTFKVPFGANQHWAHLVIYGKKLYVRHGTSLMVYDIAAK
jgi:outer membrane protein assembly factor BamB